MQNLGTLAEPLSRALVGTALVRTSLYAAFCSWGGRLEMLIAPLLILK